MDLATILLSTLLLGSTVADVETTLAFPTGVLEQNPVARSFSTSRLALYGYTGAVGVGVSVLSQRMREWPKTNRAWRLYRVVGWVLPVLLIAVQSAAAAHNSRVGR